MIEKNEELKLNDTIKQNSKGQVILGKLEGPCADCINATRNDRKYNEVLWEKVFNDPIVNEYFQAGGILGELNHPTDRLETDLAQVAICMPEKPKKDDKGQLIASFDILDTPNGRIAYTLAKYGYKLGVSSRGDGEVIDNYDGTERVDENSYSFQAFDLVLLPAVKAARLKMVESLEQTKKLKQALLEELEKANPDEKRIMTETLNKLNIEYTPEKVIDKSTTIAAINEGANIVKDLQESLLVKQQLETKVLELQEKLSVCYAKEAKNDEDIAKYKSAIRNLSESLSNGKALQTKVDSLTEELKKKDLLISNEQEKSKNLLEKQTLINTQKSQLTESFSNKVAELKEAYKKINKLNEDIQVIKKEADNNKINLEESLGEIKKNLTIKTNEYNSKLSNTNKLIEQYRNTAKTAVNKYIESKASMLGIKTEEIKNKLPDNYSFTDIDMICEDLGNFKLKVSSLPFNLQENNRLVIKESKEPIMPKSRFDDEVDDSLLRLAKLN